MRVPGSRCVGFRVFHRAPTPRVPPAAPRTELPTPADSRGTPGHFGSGADLSGGLDRFSDGKEDGPSTVRCEVGKACVQARFGENPKI